MANSKWIENSYGCLELIDQDTGDVIERASKRKAHRTIRAGGRGPGRPTNDELAARDSGVPIRVRLYPYDPGLGELACQAIVSGRKITTLEQTIGVPYQAICQWRRENPDFDRKVQESFEARALAYEEKMIEAAESATDKNDVPAARLRFDAYRKAAEWNDPSRYGSKVTVQGNQDRPIQFTINTGFPEPSKWQQPPKLGPDGLITQEDTDK